ncbi:PilN domain-containing protein [Thioalkalivibrio paradoxus]|uniref:Fimbrial assembly protein n=1 Tax=Thioalkalivibrio paradoxus ARh 1 TaxID=713585 RepID=W0DT36_9GAMM|nr:PilN domain-containing protein [Thioalkalivibrio paradoxus]AHF00139.1 hypothetical protein THITH_10175 [Thioalkalivibrio paradoxus ARh 1]
MKQIVRSSGGALWASWRRAWQLVRHDLVRWGLLSAGPAVRVEDHQRQVWRFDERGRFVPWVGGGRARHRALLLDPEMVLRSELRIPGGERELARAAQWEVRAISPFAPEDTLWTWRERLDDPDPDWRHLELYLVHAGQARRWLDQRVESGQRNAAMELWAAPGVPLPGFGEGSRLRRRRWHGWIVGLLAVTMLALATSAVVWPVWQARADLHRADTLVRQLSQQTAEAMANRERLTESAARLEAMGPWLQETPDPVRLLDQVTDVLPDSAYLEHYHQQGRRVQMRGVASDTAALMQGLRDVPQFTSVRIPTAIARDSRTGRERFQIEFEWLAGGVQ